MPATVTSITPTRSDVPPPQRAPARRPFRDNPRLILTGIGVLVAGLIAILVAVRLAISFTIQRVRTAAPVCSKSRTNAGARRVACFQRAMDEPRGAIRAALEALAANDD